MKNLLSKSIILRFIRYIIRSVTGHSVGLIPEIKFLISTKRFGGYYGGYPINTIKASGASNIISCGVGKDITFEIALLESGIIAEDANIILIDPTDESFDFFFGLQNFENENCIIGHEKDGKKIFGKVTHSVNKRFNYIKAAIGTQESAFGRIIRHENWSDTAMIEVSHDENSVDKKIQVLSITKICEKSMINHNDIDILKLDICGAELQVLPWLMQKKIFPLQITVEFYDLSLGTKEGVQNVKRAIKTLLDKKYRFAGTDFTTKFTFIRQDETH